MHRGFSLLAYIISMFAQSYPVSSGWCCYVALFRSRDSSAVAPLYFKPVVALSFIRSCGSLSLHTWYTAGIQRECRYTRKLQLRNPGRSSGSTAKIHEKRVVRSRMVRYCPRSIPSNPVTLALLSYKSSAESSSWRAIPNYRTYRRKLLLKIITNMRFTVLTVIVSAALVAAAPVR